MSQTIIGIDPGKSGGIAIWQFGKISAQKSPATEKDLWDLLRPHSGATTFIEKVSAGPKMGSAAAFKFGRGCGLLHMALIASGMRIEYVTPAKWQKEFGLIVKGRGLGQGDTAKKNRNKAKAQELFPQFQITHSIADALLILEYGVRAGRRAASVVKGVP